MHVDRRFLLSPGGVTDKVRGKAEAAGGKVRYSTELRRPCVIREIAGCD